MRMFIGHMPKKGRAANSTMPVTFIGIIAQEANHAIYKEHGQNLLQILKSKEGIKL